MTTTVCTVTGMTCGHCVQAVSTEVSKVEHVTGVEVNLETRALTVTSDGPIDNEAVIAAVDEAGYQATV